MCSGSLFAQNLDGDSFLKEDVDFLFRKLDISANHFSFSSPEGKSIRIVLEQFSSEKKVKEVDLYGELAPLLAMSDEPVSHYYPEMDSSKKTTLRVYIQKTKKGVLISWERPTLSGEKAFVFGKTKHHLTRRFDSIPSELRSKQPLVVFYANHKGELLYCPGDAPPADIVKMYDEVVLVYATI